jgi:hypothetical protein
LTSNWYSNSCDTCVGLCPSGYSLTFISSNTCDGAGGMNCSSWGFCSSCYQQDSYSRISFWNCEYYEKASADNCSCSAACQSQTGNNNC